jgi:hypothetical protein
MHRPGLALLALLALLGLPDPALAQDEKPDKPKIKRRPDVITAAEIAQRSDLQNAYEAVQRLRSAWLRTRDIGSAARGPAPIVVYIDGARASGLDDLRTLHVSMVVEMQKLSANDATTRYGTDHMSGAILVTTARRSPDH